MKFEARVPGASRLLPFFLLIGSLTVAAAEEGIFAEFNTSMGSYTCRLEYAKAPMACANFIGLATGERAWLELPTGLVKAEPFYDGTTFHRVITNFMNQGGSPNGMGTDGPGYAFVDEFDPTLRHEGFGVLSSANSGPDSNGAQFFITVATADWLDDVHTVFGKLTGGSNVVYAINHVATTNEKPVVDVVLNSVVIRRVGAAAEAFDIHAQGLPEVVTLTSSIAQQGTNAVLSYANQLYADNRLYSASNLTEWSGKKLGIELDSPFANTVVRHIAKRMELFRMAQIRYPSSTLAPKDVLDRVLTLYFDYGDGTNVITFDGAGGGTYEWTLGFSGTVTEYTWDQLPYNGAIWPIYLSGLYPMTMKLNFTNELSGKFSGTYHSSNPFSFSGGFTLEP